MEVIRSQIDVRGRVQGVGFRPFVYRLARELGLAGSVGNNSQGVAIDVEGPADGVASFLRRLKSELPPLAAIERMSTTESRPLGRRAFVIVASERAADGSPASAHAAGQADGGRVQEAQITPDSAVCADCLRELRDPSDRRHGYAFTNCTNCGPRYSIVRGVPYDRPNTTMAGFTMCPDCQREYDDPGDRRFHAQPNACPECGPRLWLVETGGAPVEGDPVTRAADAIQAGLIVAVKGLGGFHLACRADDEAVVRRLRERKDRETKPFAIMVADLAAARRICRVSVRDATLLQSPAAPIVLMPKLAEAAICPAVAPDTGSFGVVLAYTPLHRLLFDRGLGPLVMTSGNPSDEPLCADNDEALRRLAPLADLLLMHDRDIHARNDDSVVVGGIDPPIPLRRARGYVPGVVTVPGAATEPVLALGGDLKSTFCVLHGHDAVVSEHFGDLSSAVTFRHYVASIDRLCRLLRITPRRLAHDLHPGYQSTAYARALAGRFARAPVAVQHHHAHVVSCMVENGVSGRVVGVACDGTGYGPDGAIWGCEVLVCDESGYERAGHLRYSDLPGGEAAAKETWRPAVSLLRQAYGEGWREAAPEVAARIDDQALSTVERMLTRGVNSPPTSSLGRLFDAVAFLLGVADENGHEAQAAMALEAVATATAEPLPFDVADEEGRAGLVPRGRQSPGGCEYHQGGSVADGTAPLRSRLGASGSPTGNNARVGPLVMDVRAMLRAIVEQRRAGRSVAELAAAFHATVAAMLAETAGRVARRDGLDTVALSGGCFLNRLLTEQVRGRLMAAGLKVLTHRVVPPGDGGISLGQAVVAAQRVREGAT